MILKPPPRERRLFKGLLRGRVVEVGVYLIVEEFEQQNLTVPTAGRLRLALYTFVA